MNVQVAPYGSSANCYTTGFNAESVYVTCIETDVAHHLNDLLEEFPELMVGSYPKMSEEGYRTLITIESREESYAARAVEALLSRIPADYVLRVE